MKIIEHILTEEEKFILENKFVLSKNSSKINFETFTSHLISRYTGNPFDFRVQPKNPEYSIELVWNKDLEQTALMRFFADYKFSLSNSKMKGFKIFNGDVNRVDINNESAILKLARNRGQLNVIQMLMRNNEDGFNFKQINNDGDSIHTLALETITKDMNAPQNISHLDMKIFDLIKKVDLIRSLLENWIEEIKGKNEELDNKVYKVGKSTIDLMVEKIKEREETLQNKYNFGMLFEDLNYSDKLLLSQKLKEDLPHKRNLNKRSKI
jgi:hypothetical protein